VIHAGVITSVENEEGCKFSNPCLREIRQVRTAQRTFDIPTQKITDSDGNPLIVSGILTYRFTDPRKALLNVRNPENFVRNAASAALREVVGKFSYDELKDRAEEVATQTTRVLQPRVTTAGALIQNVTLNGLAYATEISQVMLRKQQAQALIDARQLLVEGSTQIAVRAVQTLENQGVQMSESEKAKLVSDLIVISIGDGSGANGGIQD